MADPATAATATAEDGGGDTRPRGTSLERGVGVIAAHLRNFPSSPGIYRMIGAKGAPLYVGKAKNLRRRVTSYTRPDSQPTRIRRMIAATMSMEVITTHTEAEALLLESNLIKQLKPRYNIIMRDDKSYPYILITADHDWPRLVKHRGARNRKGEYFGPFASAGAVNRTLNALQRVFPLRSCSDSIFASRSRPCLQYQIKRCTGPCVERTTQEAYREIVGEAQAFLSGRSRRLQRKLSDQMEAASENLEYESAAVFRDRIRALTEIQAHQDINIRNLGAADIVAAFQDGGQTCIQVFFFRAGQNYGNRTYFPNHARDLPPEEIMEAFIGQFYTDKTPPPLVLTSHALVGGDLLQEALGVRAGRRVELTRPVRGVKRKLVDNALVNARESLGRHLSESAAQRRLLEGTAKLFALDGPPRRIEVYDNSHISGSNAIGAMIVAGPEGLMKNAYRRFNIKDKIAPGDDYAMMREVLRRRFSRALKEDPDRVSGNWPDLVMIDGGPGQLGVAREVFADLGIADLALVGIAKGPDRDAGRERFHMAGRNPFTLPTNDPVLYFLQRLRDEAHRFAIGGHRARRSRDIGKSPLDEIAGVGSRRKRSLLNHFGSAAGVSRAGLADLEKVGGISGTVARKIYDHFHDTG